MIKIPKQILQDKGKEGPDRGSAGKKNGYVRSEQE
jgi:hypothetical protein